MTSSPETDPNADENILCGSEDEDDGDLVEHSEDDESEAYRDSAVRSAERRRKLAERRAEEEKKKERVEEGEEGEEDEGNERRDDVDRRSDCSSSLSDTLDRTHDDAFATARQSVYDAILFECSSGLAVDNDTLRARQVERADGEPVVVLGGDGGAPLWTVCVDFHTCSVSVSVRMLFSWWPADPSSV